LTFFRPVLGGLQASDHAVPAWRSERKVTVTRKLGDRSTLEVLKKEAKRWLKRVRSGDPRARARLLESYAAAPAEPTLRDVQHALSRELGAKNWRKLKDELEDRALEKRSELERAALFLDLSCLSYGVRPGSDEFSGHPDGPERRARAARMLEHHPELARHGIHTAVVCGDLDAVRGFLDADPEGAAQRGGPQRWEPLLFLAYGRLPLDAARDNAVPIATLLLEHGADPNAYWTYRWDRDLMKWPVLCGVIGDGEPGLLALPPHPKADELARLLLERGADPNPSQALYNTMLRGDDTHWLELLMEYGLGPRDPIAWSDSEPRANLFQFLLGHAVARGQLARAQILLEHGADPNGAEGRSYYERALLSGSPRLAELLAEHGARKTELGGADAFEAACMNLDETTARRLFVAHPDHQKVAGCLLVYKAASSRDMAGVAKLVLDLGVSPDFEVEEERFRALHHAACSDAVGVVELLIQRGADVDARDGRFNSAPIGWALHNVAPGALALLSRHTRCVFSLVAGGLIEPLRALLEREPALGRSKVEGERALGLGQIGAAPGETPLFVLPENEDLALELAELLVARGADPAHRSRAGKTAIERAKERGLEGVADALTLALERTGRRIVWFEAAEEGDAKAAVRLLRHDPSLIHERRRRHEGTKGGVRWGVTALHVAAQRGHRDLAEVLIDAGADLEARASGNEREGGGTALHWAAYNQRFDVVKLLVERGADLNPKEDAGEGAETGGPGKSFDLFRHRDIGRYLVDHGARVTLFAAISLDLLEHARLLLSAEPTLVSAREYLEWTPLHLAARENKVGMVDLLVAHGAALDARDRHGRSPIDLALLAGRRSSHERLRAHGAVVSLEAVEKAGDIGRAERLRCFFDACTTDVTMVREQLESDPSLVREKLPYFWPDNYVGGTALHLAAALGDGALVDVLLSFGADASVTDACYGGTPAGWAGEFDRSELRARLEALERAAEA
jgi:ankyrin repeat protein